MLMDYAGKSPEVAANAFVAENAVLIGDVKIGSHCSVWFNVVLRGDDGTIRIGEQSNIQDGTIVHDQVLVGERVTIGHGCLIHGCTIENDVKIGMGSIILDEAVIGSGSIIAAGSLVLSGTVVPPHTLYAGSPAVLKRELPADQAESNRRTVEHYLRLKTDYQLSKDV